MACFESGSVVLGMDTGAMAQRRRLEEQREFHHEHRESSDSGPERQKTFQPFNTMFEET